ncbi:hypothetical protein M885DRAFT_496621 [Pelagophyceae sp. CCMP2097]|nr:hypothetical protein M885DRAFT_496621 [Pelagophyceae sp. CCMP2097]
MRLGGDDGWRGTGDENVFVRLGDESPGSESGGCAVYSRLDPLDARPLDDVFSALVSARERGRVVESASQRVRWAQVLRRAASSSAAPSTLPLASYHFVFRDYVNAEELSSMMQCRGSALLLLFRLAEDTELTVHESGCSLQDTFLLFGLLPIRIRWEGVERNGQIDWTSTSARIGWRRCGKTVLSPKAAEKLRHEPWRFQMANGGRNIIFERVGVGNLVFAADDPA